MRGHEKLSKTIGWTKGDVYEEKGQVPTESHQGRRATGS